MKAYFISLAPTTGIFFLVDCIRLFIILNRLDTRVHGLIRNCNVSTDAVYTINVTNQALINKKN